MLGENQEKRTKRGGIKVRKEIILRERNRKWGNEEGAKKGDYRRKDKKKKEKHKERKAEKRLRKKIEKIQQIV